VAVNSTFKKTDLGDFPSDWREHTVGEFKPFVTSGSRGWAAHYSETGSPFIRITNLSRDWLFLDLADLKHVRLPTLDAEGKRTQLCDGDVLVSITADIGIIGYVTNRVPKPSYINQHIALVRFEPEEIESKFVSYFLSSEITQRLFRALTDGGAKAGMNLSTVRQMKVVLPPTRTEQEAIANALSDADAHIESLEKLIEKKRQIKKGAMQELLTGKRRLPGFKGAWVKKTLGELATIKSGGTPSTNQASFWDGEIPWCTPTDITALAGRKYLSGTARTITSLGLKQSSAEWIEPNSIVMTSRATIGECAINRTPVTTNQGFKNFVPNQNVSVDFLYYLLLTQKQGFIGLCSGSTFLEISKAQVSRYEVYLPAERTEQEAIATCLSDLDSDIGFTEDKLSKARLIKQGMMQELLTGRIRLV
jgi:type I restriction enzyme S subunit